MAPVLPRLLGKKFYETKKYSLQFTALLPFGLCALGVVCVGGCACKGYTCRRFERLPCVRMPFVAPASSHKVRLVRASVA